jgi:hypothetical protein
VASGKVVQPFRFGLYTYYQIILFVPLLCCGDQLPKRENSQEKMPRFDQWILLLESQVASDSPSQFHSRR